MVLTALSYAKMCRRYPVAGSVYSYVSKSIGSKVGFVSGWTMMLDYFLLPMACYVSCGLYLNVMIPAVPVWVWIIIAIVFCGVCNYVGIGVSSFVNNINVVAPIIFLIVTLVYIINFVVGGGGEGTLFTMNAIYNAETFNAGSLMTGAAIMAVCFVGFDSVTTYSEETIEPEKTMPKAVLIICIGAAIEFFITGYLMQVGWPWAEAAGELQSVDTAFAEYTVHIGIGWINAIFVALTPSLVSDAASGTGCNCQNPARHGS